jgi:hypothetical protein
MTCVAAVLSTFSLNWGPTGPILCSLAWSVIDIVGLTARLYPTKIRPSGRAADYDGGGRVGTVLKLMS